MFDAITALCALQQESSTLKKQEMLRRYGLSGVCIPASVPNWCEGVLHEAAGKDTSPGCYCQDREQSHSGSDPRVGSPASISY